MTTSLRALARLDRYPLSTRYDPHWLVGLDMGPNPLWLLEDLARDLELRPGMHVLDLGSGLGATSVFLAREYGVRVTAADLWVDPADAARTFAAAGVSEQVQALKAEAHTLPFAPGAFDAIVCIDAYEYFGTADGYLPYLAGFLRPGGQLGVATPAMRREVREMGAIPEHIRACVGWEAIAWHTAAWWRFHWEITGLVDVLAARLQPDGHDDWLRWTRAVMDHRAESREAGRAVTAMLEADGGELLTFALLAARKKTTA